MHKRLAIPGLFLLIAAAAIHAASAPDESTAKPLFPKDGVPQGWIVTDWSDVSKPAAEGAKWEVKDGVLHGSTPRGTWLVSEKEYGDFILEYEFKLGPQGNSGCGLRFPLKGDPAFDGLEMQMADPRYYGEYLAPPIELTGALYKGLAPMQRVYKPEAWNTCRITCEGAKITIVMNGTTIIDADLDGQDRVLERGAPLKDRPRKGHIGFQELSRGGGHVMIRKATIVELG
ncbi:MAG: DUF1080 domain-containing protein [Candidatus Hydrogenedentes bacterium]|nr:DUF1080 domain-containing protein [Candidatus Hydrogenedentota bacterium]